MLDLHQYAPPRPRLQRRYRQLIFNPFEYAAIERLHHVPCYDNPDRCTAPVMGAASFGNVAFPSSPDPPKIQRTARPGAQAIDRSLFFHLCTYNGNISAQRWGADTTYHSTFNYTYDRLNRLTNGTSNGAVTIGEALAYDVMGNINSMFRADGSLSKSGTYSYIGNRLTNISGGTLATGNYAYDANGNATTDGRKGIALTYNHLNLPVTAGKTGLSLVYTYDATGRKVKKVSTTSATTTTDYVDGIQYTNGAIDFIQTEEGRAVRNGTSYVYEYNLTDHLGNVRYVFNKHPTTGAVQPLQTSDYYPFGKRFGSGGVNNYLYNGKELQEGLDQYDYGARFYDAEVGRWNVIDLLSENHYSTTPYNYVLNNPINTIDQFGLDTTNVNNLDKDKWKKFNTKNDVIGLAEVNVSFNKGEAKAAAAYNTILGEVQENYKNGVGWRFQGYPDNLQYKAAERFYEKYYAHNEIDPFTGRPRVIGLEDANWIIDLAAGGIVSLVKTGAAVSATSAVEGSYSVYTGLENGVVKYIGITSRNSAKRFAEHRALGGAKSLLDFDVLKGASGLSKTQAKLIEQNLINKYGLPNLYNKINSIAPKKWGQFGVTP